MFVVDGSLKTGYANFALFVYMYFKINAKRPRKTSVFLSHIWGHIVFFSFLLGILFATPYHRFDLYYSLWDVVHLYSERKYVFFCEVLLMFLFVNSLFHYLVVLFTFQLIKLN